MYKRSYLLLALFCFCLASCTATADLVRSTVPALAAKKSFTVEDVTIRYRVPAEYMALEGNLKFLSHLMGYNPFNGFNLKALYMRDQFPAHLDLAEGRTLLELFGILTPGGAASKSMTPEEFQDYIVRYRQGMEEENNWELMAFDSTCPLEEFLGQPFILAQTNTRFTMGWLPTLPLEKRNYAAMNSIILVQDRLIFIRHALYPHTADHLQFFMERHERLLRELNLS